MKVAYPNFSENMTSTQAYDLNKWMSAMKDIYIKLHLGNTKNDSVNYTIKDWNQVEKKAFLDWLKYYESGDQHKYKMAQQSYYVNDDINYFIPNPPNAPNPLRNINEQVAKIPQEATNIVSNRPNEMSNDDKRKIIEDQRRKIIARLNAAEKLLSSHQGQIFAGVDFEKLLISIYELKKQIQTVNKTALSSQTIVDLIVRQANILSHQGYNNASNFMVKFAQNTPGDFSVNFGEIPAGGSQPQGGGSLGNSTPDLFQMPGGPSTKEITEDSAVGQFIDNLENSGLTKEEDENSSKDTVVIDDDVILDQEITPEHNNDLIVEAQEIPAPKNPTIDTKPVISPEEVQKVPQPQMKTDIDDVLDTAFANITINDVINKLDSINNIFRNREISRQLAIVDIMLSRLGLATYFPTLSEATNRSLDANQYCLTRIEDILSKLRGVAGGADIDLKPQPANKSSVPLQQQLEQSEQKDKQRKEIKKQIEDKKISEEMKPEGEVENVQQELASQPVQVEPQVPPNPKLLPTV